MIHKITESELAAIAQELGATKGGYISDALLADIVNTAIERIAELEKGSEPVALGKEHRYLIRYSDDAEFGQAAGWLYSRADDTYEDGTPAYVWRALPIPPTANAAVAAALMKAEEVCNNSPKIAANDHIRELTSNWIKEEIRAIPRDESALVEFGMKVLRKKREPVA